MKKMSPADERWIRDRAKEIHKAWVSATPDLEPPREWIAQYVAALSLSYGWGRSLDAATRAAADELAVEVARERLSAVGASLDGDN